jgi:UPF0755 protein
LRTSLALTGALLLIGGVAWYGYRVLDLPPRDFEVHHVVEIPADASFTTVAGLLAQKGLIVSPFWFRVLGKIQGAERNIKPGEYDLHTRMRPPEILDALVKGKVIHYSVLIPEGFNASQVGKLLSELSLADDAAINRLVKDREFAKSLGVEGATLEGYLFPDTYYFSRHTRPEEILKAMVGRFQQVVSPELKGRAADLRMTEREVLTLASIIEKETGQEDERPLISAVFHNRLKKRFPLQSDPTVIYDIPNFDGNLTRAQLTTPSPFNTYMHPGLPPGPIANPGLKSIMAAMNPAPVPYLYFVSKNDGSHQFSSTLQEHNRAVDRYQKKGGGQIKGASRPESFKGR